MDEIQCRGHMPPHLEVVVQALEFWKNFNNDGNPKNSLTV